MVKRNNPAGRLHILLSEARAKNTSNQARVVWAEVLRAEEGSDESVVLRFLQLIRLFRETKEALEKVEGINKDLYLGEMYRIQNMLFVETLFRPWNDVKSNLSDTVMQALAFGAERLSELPQYKEPGEDEISELLREVDLLIERIVASSLDSKIQALLLKLLGNIRNALIEYKIRGTARLLEVLEENTGILVVNAEEIKSHRQEREVIDVGKLWQKFMEIVTVAAGVQQLAPPAIELLHRLLSP